MADAIHEQLSLIRRRDDFPKRRVNLYPFGHLTAGWQLKIQNGLDRQDRWKTEVSRNTSPCRV